MELRNETSKFRVFLLALFSAEEGVDPLRHSFLHSNIDVDVDIHGCGNVGVSQPDLDFLQRECRKSCRRICRSPFWRRSLVKAKLR